MRTYSKTELFCLLDMVIELFKKEKTLAEISPPVTIVGDIHGQFEDLVRLLNTRNSSENAKSKPIYGFSTKKWVFLGDYVDRGYKSLDCICLVFSLKICFPKQYILLRGNHETRAINFRYGFRVCSVVVLKIPAKPSFIRNNKRGLSVCFNEAAVNETCRLLNISLIVRGHQMMPAGFKFFADRKLCTIFSAPRYMNEIDNSGAVMKVASNGKISISIMKNPNFAMKMFLLQMKSHNSLDHRNMRLSKNSNNLPS
ncbi:uncharacterized protein CELE_F44B9.9 [Caenorhabditis elegans]|uniref:Uncharacterized protein F44B9.9 n=1 Tax=Caenorhabditis elegans TaxID=6239 RepID=YL39_CAEEL|nr:Uncharacterized protein CELE_F44B9.9 [Caenorhabditis elegans]P34430.3 RecName: Full=Uncharacterized protein F44B9.9 [Caenorhabditis elegans]CCD63452.2 Uncharacterized protein CELE_F44B9.9 [Caenorhabditis elegans]